ncbi:hypothetical protein [Lentilactobacillus curieae]|nr:hypothetical protein [Lentilactobacillus curieae]
MKKNSLWSKISLLIGLGQLILSLVSLLKQYRNSKNGPTNKEGH